MNRVNNSQKQMFSGIPTEPVGSIPRPRKPQEALVPHSQDTLSGRELDWLVFDEVVKSTIIQFAAIGSPVISDGEHSNTNC